MTESGRATIFGRDAAAYERARPGYPAQAIDHMLGLTEARHVLEIGAGTGKATSSVARSGMEILCLEPSAEMAGVLEERALPGVKVVRETFEEWASGDHSFDLIYAAQAWHWVDPDTGLEKALRVLNPGGALALLWNLPEHRYDEFEAIYRRHAPHLLDEQDDRIKRRDDHDWLIDLGEAGFVELDRFSHNWSVELTAATYRELYSTYSDHILLPESTREALLDELEAAVVERGGSLVQGYTTEVFSGLKAAPDRR